MGKKFVFPIIVGVLIVVLGIVFFAIPRSNSLSSNKKNENQATTASTGDLYSQIKSDLGQQSTKDQTDPLAELNVDENLLKDSKAYQKALTAYKVLPEQLLATRKAISDLEKSGTRVLGNLKVSFNLSVSSAIKDALDKQAKSASVLTSVPVYSFKSNFDETFYKTLANSFGISEDKAVITKDGASGEYFITNFPVDQDKSSLNSLKAQAAGNSDGILIVFNPASGSFTYSKEAAVSSSAPVGAASKTATEAAQNFILNNPTAKTYTANLDQSETTVYERKDTPGVVYVAFHRGWKVLPILNAVSIQSLATLKSSIKETIQDSANRQFMTSDANIINTSDKLDGLARADDFNTITVAIDKKTSSVLGADFAMRPLEENEATKAEIISAQEAFDNAKSGEIYQSVITPFGDGTPNYETAFPKNIASSDSAEVKAVYLAYLEEPLTNQINYSQPVYIFKGEATLDTGYKVAFSFVTPAVKQQKLSLLSFAQVSAEIADQPASQDNVQVGAWTPSPSEIDNPTNTGSQTPTPSSAAPPSSGAPGGCESDPQYQPRCPNFKNLRLIGSDLYAGYSGKGAGFLVAQPESVGINKVAGAEKKFADKTFQDVVGPYLDYQGKKCFFNCKPYLINYLSSVTPIINLYSNSARTFEVTPKSSGAVTYAYPERSSGSWNVAADQSGNLVSGGKTYDQLYYEFTDKNIAISPEGFVVEKSKTEDFLKNSLLPKLNLNQKEIDAYLADIKTHIFSQTSSDTGFYKISLEPKAEIEKILPLRVNPRPSLEIRNFLTFEKLKTKPNHEITEPEINNRLDRTKFDSVLVENGCLLD